MHLQKAVVQAGVASFIRGQAPPVEWRRIMAVWLFFLLVTLALPHVGNGSTDCDAVLIASLVQEQCDGEPVTRSCCEVLRTIITPSRGKLPCLRLVLDQPELKYSGFTRGLLLDMAKSCTASRAPPPAYVTAGSPRPKDRDVGVAKAKHEESHGGAGV